MNPASGNELPRATANQTSPMPATAVPTICDRRGRSPRTSAARMTVKKTCDCWTTAASPEGIPNLMARKSSPNWPRKVKRPKPRKRRRGIRGLGSRKTAGSAVSSIRRPPRTNGEIPRSPSLMTTKFTPQSSTTARARATSRGDTALPRRGGDALQGVADRGRDRRRLAGGALDEHVDERALRADVLAAEDADLVADAGPAQPGHAQPGVNHVGKGDRLLVRALRFDA